jgi:integrase
MDKKILKRLESTQGVSLRGNALLISFNLPDRRHQVKRSLGIEPTIDNILKARKKLSSIDLDVEFGLYNNDQLAFWQKHFPSDRGAPKSCYEVMSDYYEYKLPKVSASTSSGISISIDKFKSEIGGILAKSLTTRDLERVQTTFINSGLKASTINTYFDRIAPAFKRALRDKILVDNPFADFDHLSTKHEVDDVDPFDSSEYNRIIEKIKEPSDRNMVTLLFWTGLRPGELAALAWEDIDLKKRVLKVVRNKSGSKYKLPKTESSVREIELLEPAYQALLAQKEITFMLKKFDVPVVLAFKDIRTDVCRFVFYRIPGGNNGGGSKPSPFSTSQIFNNEKWNNFLRVAGVRWRRPYQTRHSYASWLLSNGAEPLYVAKQMGHKDWGMIRNIYGKWIEQEPLSYRDALNEKLGFSGAYMEHKKGINS